MLRSRFSFIRFFVFWLLLFAITRTTFELFFYSKLKGSSFSEIALTYLYGLRMDASAAAYIAVIPLLVFIINWFIPGKHIKAGWLRFYIWFCLFFISLIAIIDLNIFTEWGAKVNFRAFDTLFNAPAESFSSTASSPVALSVCIALALLISGIVLAHFIIDYSFQKPAFETRSKLIISSCLIIANFLVLRGSVTFTPLNQSMVYFSDNQLLDLSAQNTEWNLANNVFENLRQPYNPYLFMPPGEAKNIVRQYFAIPKDTTVRLLTTDKPNVVIIQLESFTADLIESLGGEKGDAPNFENFRKNGLLFNNIYAAGDRTDKGIIAILSGFPSQATRTIIVKTQKQKKLPSLLTSFKNIGYRVSYFYGGLSNYMNFNNYMYDHKIDDIIDESHFVKNEIGSAWGVNDHLLFNKHLAYLNRLQKPFFSLLQTSTNHEPFILPVAPHFSGKEVSDQFRSTAFYTDSSLNVYFNEAKKQAWYKNTLFILVADHGHRLPKSTSMAYDPAKYHIPLLFFGDVIKPEFRGKQISKLGNQTDIAATLLSQLNLPHQQFEWSKDLLNPYAKEFAFFDWDNGFGFMMQQQAVSYDNSGQRIIYLKNQHAGESLTAKTLLAGKAFMQLIFTEYLKY